MDLRSIEGVYFAGARVLMRVDLNIEQSNIGDIEEHFRLDIAKKTVDRLIENTGVKVALLTHFGRPDGQPNPDYSVAKLTDAVARSLKREVVFVPDCVGQEVVSALDALLPGQVLLLENVRFYPEEETNDT